MNKQTQRYATAEGIRANIKWLYNAWLNVRDDPDYLPPQHGSVQEDRMNKFLERLHTTVGSDAALRALTGYSGCVFQPKRCPTSGPMVCAACAEE
jgi:hypothetical protein